MDIYFSILGRNVRTEPLHSWLDNADDMIRDGVSWILPNQSEHGNPPNNPGNAPKIMLVILIEIMRHLLLW